jgi:hypothetical protein
MVIPLWATFRAEISPITAEVKSRMLHGHSWHEGCPVDYHNLRYVRMTYLGFDGREHIGEMIVHKRVAKVLTQTFEALYDMRYPIRQMRLVSDYGGSDWKSIEADNTSAFNCRNATGSTRWSKHSYGRAIDINPIENPYISRNGHIAHKASLRYRKRSHTHDGSAADRAVLLKDDEAAKMFQRYGWKWGGNWYGVKDYQHFSQ